MKDFTIVICEETIQILANYQMGGERKGGRKEGITLSVVWIFLHRLKTTFYSGCRLQLC